MDDDLISVAESPEANAAEDAAFAASFSETRGEEPTKTDAEPAPAEEPVAEGVGGVEAPATPETPADPVVETPKLFAGLTEEQLQAALARSGSLQGTVDKMAGRIGQLMQQIDSLRTNPPTTQQAQKALDLKLEKLSGAFPELANLLREDLAGLQGGGGELPVTAPAGITQEQFDTALASRLQATQATLTEQMEVKVLTIVHPDWNKVIRTNEFALWRDNVLGPEEGKKLMFSEDSSFISQRLTEFKKWREASAPPTPTQAAPVVPIQSARTTRLTNAVLPVSGAKPVQAPVTEDDAFAAAFNRERGRA